MQDFESEGKKIPFMQCWRKNRRLEVASNPEMIGEKGIEPARIS